MFRVVRLGLFVMAWCFAGCATIFGHNEHSMRVSTAPSGAKVYLNGAPVGQTPTEFTVDDLGTPNNVSIRLPGYREEKLQVMRKMQTVAFCNLLNPICWLVDYATDSMFEVKNPEVHLDLIPDAPAPIYRDEESEAPRPSGAL